MLLILWCLIKFVISFNIKQISHNGERDLVMHIDFERNITVETVWNSKSYTIESVINDCENHYCIEFLEHDLVRNNTFSCKIFAMQIYDNLNKANASWASAVGVNYIQVVEQAYSNDIYFNTFKSQEAYIGVVETVNEILGMQYLHYLIQYSPYTVHDPNVFNLIQLLIYFEQSDRIGTPYVMLPISLVIPSSDTHADNNPMTYSYQLSATTARYWKVTYDLDLLYNIFGMKTVTYSNINLNSYGDNTLIPPSTFL